MLYSYTARSLTGDEIKKGEAEAANEHELARTLHNEGYLLVSSRTFEKKETGKDLFHKISKTFEGLFGVPLIEKTTFTLNLAVMIGAGLSLNRALEVLAKQTKNAKFKKAILETAADVAKGSTFGDALDKQRSVFNELYVNMIRTAETAGNLEEVLKLLASQMKKEHELISRVRGAMVYPAVIIVAMLGIGALMMVVIVPKLADSFKEMGVELPWTTKLVIGFSNFLISYWYIFLLFIAIFVFTLRIAVKTKKGKRIIDFILLKTPIFGSLTKKINSARFARTLSSLIASGVAVVKAFEILSNTLTNHYYSASLKDTAVEIQKGKKIFETLEKYPHLYPPMVTEMVAVGEETGALSDILEKLSVFFEEDVDNTTKSLSTIIEPLLMIVIGVVVGFFAISMLQPMYSLIGAQ